MRFDNIFIPKGNGLGWTLNFENPLSVVIVVIFTVFLAFFAYKKLKYILPAIFENWRNAKNK
jgi:hypothetical protein